MALSNTGYDAFYLLPNSKQEQESKYISPGSYRNLNAKTIGKHFLQEFDIKTQNRVLLSRFMSVIA